MISIALPIGHVNAQSNFTFGREDEEKKNEKPFINPYDKKYRPAFLREQDENASKALLPKGHYRVEIVRKTNTKPHELKLAISAPGNVSGCLTVTPPISKNVKFGKALQLRISEGIAIADTKKTRYYHHECKPTTGASQSTLTLNTKELMKKEINKLILASEKQGAFAEMDLIISDEKIDITQKSLNKTKPERKTTYWFYPENTLVLSAPSSKSSPEQTSSALEALALKNGLTPLVEKLEGFEPSFEHRNKFFAIDRGGRFKNRLVDQNDSFTLGTITGTQTRFTANGPQDVPATYKTIARMPGIYE